MKSGIFIRGSLRAAGTAPKDGEQLRRWGSTGWDRLYF